jgi:enoyl-CoA hydratase/carnithine racemase
MRNSEALPIQQTIADGVMTIRLCRPEKKNAVTFAMWTELGRVFRAVERDPAVRVVILTGSGGCFSAVADISEFPSLRSTPSQVAAYETAVDGALAAIAASSKPVVAAVTGVCFAGGLALAASADFRVADETASFAVSAVRMGLVYNIAKCARLYQVMGLVNAKRMLLTGDRFSAIEAKSMGLVDVVAQADVMEEARVLSRSMARGAPLALEGIKAILEALADQVTDARRPVLESGIARADASADHREAVEAFASKRVPVFRGT